MKVTIHILSRAEVRNEWSCTSTRRHTYIHTEYGCKLIFTLLNDRERLKYALCFTSLIFTVSLLKV